MDKTTITIIIAVAAIWIVLTIFFVWLNKKRKGSQSSLLEKNKDKAILHLYCKNITIDGRDLAIFEPVTGEYGQKIVALPAGSHTIEGVFETTEITMTGKNRNLVSEKLSFDLDLEAGHQYTAGMYSYPPEEGKSDYEGNAGKDIFTMPLTAYEGSSKVAAYIICYQED